MRRNYIQSLGIEHGGKQYVKKNVKKYLFLSERVWRGKSVTSPIMTLILDVYQREK